MDIWVIGILSTAGAGLFGYLVGRIDGEFREHRRCQGLCLQMLTGEKKLSPSVRRLYKAISEHLERVPTEDEFFGEAPAPVIRLVKDEEPKEAG